VRRIRRGSALVLVLLLTVALASLALSAIYMSFNGTILSRSYEREQDFRYAAEAALAMGKSRLNNDPYSLPDTGYVALTSNGTVTAADGTVIPGVQVDVYLGPTGSTSGQFGRFASVVADAHDRSGARYVRRLELVQESFAKFAYWTDKEDMADGTTIYFNNGDVLFGPVWTNDDIHIGDGKATFNDEVGTAKTIQGKNYGTFKKGYTEHAKPIQLPDNTVLSKLQGYATAGSFAFNAPTTGDASTASMRIEFVPIDLKTDEDSVPKGPDEGFFRVYQAKNASYAGWVRGDYLSTNCGDWHWDKDENRWEFFPAAVHSKSGWYNTMLRNNETMTNTQYKNEENPDLDDIMTSKYAPYGTPIVNGGGKAPPRPAPRCYPGGDPHLVAVENSSKQIGGTDSTFEPSDSRGAWVKWTGTVPTQLTDLGRPDADYLFPLYRGFNPGTQGVIYVAGTVAVNGVLRGRVTLYATGNVVIPDNLTYETNPNPAANICADMLGIIAKKNVVVADNAINTPQKANSKWVTLGSTPVAGITIQGVMMTLGSSFTVEDYDEGPTNAAYCGTTSNKDGRGCLNLTGGVIQDRRGPVGLSSGEGYVKRYTYDRCALITPPPFFPTTGRFMDNRYYEVDPSGFQVADLFQKLKPKS
jgi:hypothetical protein